MLRARRDGTPFQVTGTDWPTRDGTGIRDYVHVWDLARAHVAALERFDDVVGAAGTDGSLVVNLGTGTGTTVRELLDALRAVVGAVLRSTDAPPRPGDVAGCCTRSARARELLGGSRSSASRTASGTPCDGSRSAASDSESERTDRQRPCRAAVGAPRPPDVEVVAVCLRWRLLSII